MDTYKKGAVYALALGLPAGLICCSLFLSLSQYFPFSLLLKVSGFRVFWNPLSWVAVAAMLGVSLWQCGLRISSYLEKHDVLRTSFMFTIRVNLRLLIGLVVIYIGGIGLRMLTGYKPLLAAIPYGIIAIAGLLALATLVATVTISLVIVQLTKNKLKITPGSQDPAV